MMPGIGLTEMILLVVMAIVVIGPKDLPLMMRRFGQFTGKMRAMAFEFKQGFDELGRQAELEELRKEVADLKKHTGLEDIERDLSGDMRQIESDVNRSLEPPPSVGEPAPGTPPPAGEAAAANGIAPYPGLSAEDPGYGHGENGFPVESHETAAVAPAPVAPVEPVKQDTPA